MVARRKHEVVRGAHVLNHGGKLRTAYTAERRLRETYRRWQMLELPGWADIAARRRVARRELARVAGVARGSGKAGNVRVVACSTIGAACRLGKMLELARRANVTTGTAVVCSELAGDAREAGAAGKTRHVVVVSGRAKHAGIGTSENGVRLV